MYHVIAWREPDGTRGITVGIRTPHGWDNIVAEELLIEDGVGRFIQDCCDAWARAHALEPSDERQSEPMPGPYSEIEEWT